MADVNNGWWGFVDLYRILGSITIWGAYIGWRIYRIQSVGLLNNDFHSKTLHLCCLMSLCFLLFSQANQVLQSFLQSQAEVEAAILKVDQALTDADKAMAGTGRTELSEG